MNLVVLALHQVYCSLFIKKNKRYSQMRRLRWPVHYDFYIQLKGQIVYRLDPSGPKLNFTDVLDIL
jgi:hypothetical protein